MKCVIKGIAPLSGDQLSLADQLSDSKVSHHSFEDFHSDGWQSMLVIILSVADEDVGKLATGWKKMQGMILTFSKFLFPVFTGMLCGSQG